MERSASQLQPDAERELRDELERLQAELRRLRARTQQVRAEKPEAVRVLKEAVEAASANLEVEEKKVAALESQFERLRDLRSGEKQPAATQLTPREVGFVMVCLVIFIILAGLMR